LHRTMRSRQEGISNNITFGTGWMMFVWHYFQHDVRLYILIVVLPSYYRGSRGRGRDRTVSAICVYHH